MPSCFSKNRIRFSMTVILSFFTFSVFGQQSLEFAIPAETSTDSLQGQIDWPHGRLESWNGPVVLFISAASASDRDGWQVRALETVWAERLPLKELSATLVKQGIAVIRFDNPGVLSPQKQCRQSIFKKGLTERILWQRCLDLATVARFTPIRYWEAIEKMLPRLQNLMPAIRNRLFLFGFSEGLMHAAAIADRGGVRPQGFISLGSPAETFESAARWQATDRITEALVEFDTSGDGIVTNEEIKKGYNNGINNFMNLEGWLSASGAWDSTNRGLLAKDMALYYEKILRDYRDVSGAGTLYWVAQANGVKVPDMTDALWHYYFYGKTSPAEVMQRLKIPGLFMWGDRDRQVAIDRQVTLLDQTNREGGNLSYVRFPGRHHLLSKRKDFDWFEKEFMPEIAEKVSAFVRSSARLSHSNANTGLVVKQQAESLSYENFSRKNR
jgi:hypothetical protein